MSRREEVGLFFRMARGMAGNETEGMLPADATVGALGRIAQGSFSGSPVHLVHGGVLVGPFVGGQPLADLMV